MSMSYGRRARMGVLPAATSLSDALGRIERLALPLAIVAVYPLAKRVTWWPQVMLGLAFFTEWALQAHPRVRRVAIGAIVACVLLTFVLIPLFDARIIYQLIDDDFGLIMRDKL